MSQIVLLTGVAGYIGRHIALQLLDAGYAVRGSVRSRKRAAETSAAIASKLSDPNAIERLEFIELDLLRDDGWSRAATGCHAMIHTASPFPLVQPREPQELISTAVEGTMRALRAGRSASVAKVVLTSSMVAVQYGGFPKAKPIYTEEDWTDGDDSRLTAYTRSKTLAEKAAWTYAESEGQGMALTCINPGLVVGRPLGDEVGTSLEVIRRILQAKDPALPSVSFAIVDVRDVAAMHVAALAKPEAAGRRFIAANGVASFADIARILSDAFPGRRIVTRQAPDFAIRVIGLFDRSVATIKPDLGRRFGVSNEAARRVLGVQFGDMRQAIVDSADFLLKAGKA